MQLEPEQIVTSDPEVLEAIVAFTERHLHQESQRGASAEARTSVLASLGGVAAGALLAAGILVPHESSRGTLGWLSLSCMFAGFCFAMRTIYFTMRALLGLRGLRIKPDALITGRLSGRDKEVTFKEMICWNLWDREQRMALNTRRLYYNACAAWALMLCFGFILCAGGFSFADGVISSYLGSDDVSASVVRVLFFLGRFGWLALALLLLGVAVLLIFGNRIMRRFSIWRNRKEDAG